MKQHGLGYVGIKTVPGQRKLRNEALYSPMRTTKGRVHFRNPILPLRSGPDGNMSRIDEFYDVMRKLDVD